MKKVLLKKRRFTIKDILRFILVITLHYFVFYLYLVIVIAANYLLNGGDLLKFNALFWVISYAATFAPGINALLHVIYAEKGSPWFRLVMWTHSFFIIFAVPIGVFA